MNLRDFISKLDQKTCLTIMSEMDAYESAGHVSEDAQLRRVTEEFNRQSGSSDKSSLMFMFVGMEVWRRIACGTLSPTMWNKGLEGAPKMAHEGRCIMAILPGYEAPEAVRWSAYPDDIAAKLGEAGYWDYESESISEMTGGIESKEAEKAVWTLLDLPPSQNNEKSTG